MPSPPPAAGRRKLTYGIKHNLAVCARQDITFRRAQYSAAVQATAQQSANWLCRSKIKHKKAENVPQFCLPSSAVYDIITTVKNVLALWSSG